MDVSIIIPTYNPNKTLLRCLQALEHNYADIVVVDDGSSRNVDFPANVCVVRHGESRGRAAALNSGLRAAANDLVVFIDDDIYAAPDMVVRLVEDFTVWNNPMLAIVGRVIWDPKISPTLTMRWLEERGPHQDISSSASGPLAHLISGNTVMWRPFVLEHGGFDEQFHDDGMEDLELGLRLKRQGLEVRLLSQAVGYRHKVMKVRDLVRHSLQQGRAAVYLHSKFPDYLNQADDSEGLLRNAAREKEAAAAVQEIDFLEQSNAPRIPNGIADLFTLVHRHYFLRGVLNGMAAKGTLKPVRRGTATLALYSQASHLRSMDELAESRRLFRLVRERPDSAYWPGAEYHLGLIETDLGNVESARRHFMDCLRLNPSYRKAREALNTPADYQEVESNMFERVALPVYSKLLFIVFGTLEHVLHAFPVVSGLKRRFHSSEIVWMTLPEFGPLARASEADRVREAEPRGVIPWDWIAAEGFTHVFYPEMDANHEEWEAGNLSPMDFMAAKCGVELKTRKASLTPMPNAVREAQSFMTRYGLTPNGFLTVGRSAHDQRQWSERSYSELGVAVGMPVVAVGAPQDPVLPGSIPCRGHSFQTLAALIQFSAFYLGPDGGVSWLAAITDTPMAVFIGMASDPQRSQGIKATLRGERDDIIEWSVYQGVDAIAVQILSQAYAVAREQSSSPPRHNA